MTIKRLSKKQELKDSDDEERNIEKVTEEFIGAGGKTTNELIKESSNEMRFTLRVPKNMIEDIDQIRKTLPGSVSRNTWILQLISENLASE